MTTLTVVLVAGAVWVLGRLAFELLVPADSPARRWTGPERVFTEAALASLFLAWVALVLVQTGFFSARTMLLSIGIAGVLLALLLRRSGRAAIGKPLFRFDTTQLVALGFVIAGAILYAPPFEQVIGERDPTTYVLTGASLARTGNLTMHDPVIAELTESERLEFIGGGVYFRDWQYGPRFPGWFLTDLDEGRVLPQGLPLYPTTIAVGYLFGGMSGALQVTKILAIASALALFVLARHLFGGVVGATAAVLLMVSPSQVWFSRFPNAEAPAQLLLLTGIFGLVAFRQHRAPAFGLLAALSFGLSWQAHIWTAWLVFPLFGLLIIDLALGKVRRLDAMAFWVPVCLLGLHALVVFALFEKQYLASVFVVLDDSRPGWIPLVITIIGILAGCWWWGRRRRSGVPAEASPDGTADGSAAAAWPRWVLAASIVSGAVYGYWIRPEISTAWRTESVQRLALAVTMPVFWLAVAGAVLVVLDRRREEPRTLLLVFAFGVVSPVLANPAITPALMWSLRRFQTFLPLVFLFASVAIWWTADRAREKGTPSFAARTLAVICTIVSGAVAWNVADLGLRYRGFKQPGDAIALVEVIAASVEEDAVLIFEPRSGSALLGFAPALAYWQGFDVVWLHSKQVGGDGLRSFVLRQARQGRTVYYFTQGFNYFFGGPRIVPHRTWEFEQQALEEVRNQLPDRVLSNSVLFRSYRVEPSGSNEPLDGRLDVGGWDDLYVGEVGLTEVFGDRTARWTKGVSFFWLPGLDEGVSEITVHAMSFSGSAQHPRTLRARLDDVELGEIAVEENWRDYVFEVPSGWKLPEDGVPRLEISTDPIRPDQILGNGDMRYLGVQVDTISWR